MEWLFYVEKGFWFGIGAIGFGVLFNVPLRTLFPIYVLGAIGGLAKVNCQSSLENLHVLAVWVEYSQNQYEIELSCSNTWK